MDSKAGSRNRLWLTGAVVTLIATLPWLAVPWGSFQFDDFSNVVRDPATTDATLILTQFFDRLRPLTRLSYSVDARLFGLEPAGFLATNLLLHALTTGLVFALARRRYTVLAAALAALVFSLQPTNAEVVAYVSGRSVGLMAPLLLGGLLLHDRGHWLGASVLFLLACLARETALVFPLLVAVWDAGRSGPRLTPKISTVAYVMLAAGIVVFLLASGRYRSLLDYSLDYRSPADNLLANGRAIPTMLSLWFRPWALSADHGFDPSGSVLVSVTGLSGLALLSLAALALRKRNPAVLLICVWPLIALLPTNSLLPKIDLVTEKPLYLAWVGPAIAIGYGISRLWPRVKTQAIRRLVMAAGIVFLGLAGAACAWRVSIWSDPVLLWHDATRKAPQSVRCWNNLGMAYFTAGSDRDAQQAFQTALRLDPRNPYAARNLVLVEMLCGDDCSPGRH